MAKQNPLAQGLERIANPPPPVTLARDIEPRNAKRAPSRTGQTLVGGFFAPEVHRQLKVMAAEQGTTQQALLANALNMLFASAGKPEIATLGRLMDASNA